MKTELTVNFLVEWFKPPLRFLDDHFNLVSTNFPSVCEKKINCPKLYQSLSQRDFREILRLPNEHARRSVLFSSVYSVVSSKPGKSNRRILSIKHILIVGCTRKEREVWLLLELSVLPWSCKSRYGNSQFYNVYELFCIPCPYTSLP